MCTGVALLYPINRFLYSSKSCPFQAFGQVHVVQGQDGEPWFVAKDVAEVLGYTNPQKAVRDHCKCPKILKGNDSLSLTDSPRGITIIPESDVYRLIMRSKMPQAEEIQDWVTTEILPIIRRHGAYTNHDIIGSLNTASKSHPGKVSGF